MKICHFSDNHGVLPDLPECDALVSSGDFLPNATFGLRVIEEPWQARWIDNNAEALKRFIGDKKFLISHGNHDFIDVAKQLRELDIDAVNLDDISYNYRDVTFAGFPHIPGWCWQWNRETSPEELEARVEALDLTDVDVLVAHSPLHGVLDYLSDAGSVGSKPMREKLLKIDTLKWYLCGHIHPCNGTQTWANGIQVSNAACGHRIIEV